MGRPKSLEPQEKHGTRHLKIIFQHSPLQRLIMKISKNTPKSLYLPKKNCFSCLAAPFPRLSSKCFIHTSRIFEKLEKHSNDSIKSPQGLFLVFILLGRWHRKTNFFIQLDFNSKSKTLESNTSKHFV